MDWADELRQLRSEVDSLRLERAQQMEMEERERAERHAQLKDAFESLQVEELLEEMNRVLLDRQGEVTVYSPWATISETLAPGEEDEEDEDGPEEAADVASAILTWVEDGPREIVVDLGVGLEDLYLQVNGADIRMRDDALKQALKRAFREELEE